MEMIAFCMRTLLLFVPCLVAASENYERGLVAVDETIRFELINSKTDERISTLFDGAIIDLAALGLDRPRLNVEAVMPPTWTDIGSIKFDLDDTAGFRIENTAPYYLCGVNRLGSPKLCRDLKVGQHTVTATPFTESDGGGGEAGLPSTLTFEIVESNCGIPRFVGAWERVKPYYPLSVAEAQGGMIGEDFFIASGFSQMWNQTTTEAYALNVTDPEAVWRRMDDVPVPNGITHTATAVIGTKFYMCGGYLGGNPGPETAACFVYDHSVEPGTTGQWSQLPDLPEGRAGGGMVYDTNCNALFFSGGAQRPYEGYKYAVDYPSSWMLDLSDVASGWVAKADANLLTNHISHVTAKDSFGRERHFWAGGQRGEEEANGNSNRVVEWDALKELWIEREPMALARGHATSSTRAIGCGFIVAGGTTNQYGKTSDVSYYDIPTDTWTSIGNLRTAINTPVCDISSDGYLYCQTGKLKGRFSFRIQITVS